VDDGLVRAARGGPRYLTNDLGDIDRVDDGGVIKPFDPSVWNWYGPNRSKRDCTEIRRSVDSLQGLTGFEVEEREGDRYVPGPRSRQTMWGRFADGAAPPTHHPRCRGTGMESFTCWRTALGPRSVTRIVR
jgi:hypothetical protein